MSAMTIELPTHLKAKVTKTARQLGVTPARFVCEVLESRLKKNGAVGSSKTLYDLSRDLCGSLSGGASDLSRNQAHLKDYGQWKR